MRTDAGISVILPCYNGAETVAAAVSSVWRQGRDDLEIVAIDDASTDHTLEVLGDLAARSPNPMRVVANESNQLTARSVNAVYPSAREFVTILHQDDAYPPARFDAQIDLLRADPSLQIVYANGTNFDQSGPMGPLHGEETEALLSEPPRNIERFLREHQNPIFFQPAVARRQLYERMGGFDEDCMSDDWVTYSRIFSVLNARREFDYLEHSVYLRRKHPGNFHKNHRTMTALRMQVLQKYATTERRDEVLARHYSDQAGYLIKHSFLGHAVAMLTLSALHHGFAGDDEGRTRTLTTLRGVMARIDQAPYEQSAHRELDDSVERLMVEGPSREGYDRLDVVLREHGLIEDARRVRAGIRSSELLPNMPSESIDPLMLLELPTDGNASSRGVRWPWARLRRATRLARRGSGAPIGARHVAALLWDHYLLVEMLRYDLARRGVIR